MRQEACRAVWFNVLTPPCYRTPGCSETLRRQLTGRWETLRDSDCLGRSWTRLEDKFETILGLHTKAPIWLTKKKPAIGFQFMQKKKKKIPDCETTYKNLKRGVMKEKRLASTWCQRAVGPGCRGLNRVIRLHIRDLRMYICFLCDAFIWNYISSWRGSLKIW